MEKSGREFRSEKDSLGEVHVPQEAYYGAETQRALENFQISGERPDRLMVWSILQIKKCAAWVNEETGWLKPNKAAAIRSACDEMLAGKYADQFLVDPFQAGAGTSHHMNINEVVANRASELLGGKKGAYLVNAHNDVNMAQSTNDVIPTAIRLSCLEKHKDVENSLRDCSLAFKRLKSNYQQVKKSGRTHLQDAAPISFGAEFGAYARMLERDLEWLEAARKRLLRLGIGGSAVGSGLNTPPQYAEKMAKYLSEATGFELSCADDHYESMQSMADFVNYSAALRTASVSVTKICNDLRLLASGPETGLDEIQLSAVQPGSSIMPGKVNPVIAEMVNMAMYHVMGLDQAEMLAGQAGQLELNVMMPLIAHELLEMQRIMANAIHALNEKCLAGITVNIPKAKQWLAANPLWITGLTRLIGYEAAAEIVKLSRENSTPVSKLLKEKIRRQELIDKRNGKPLTWDECQKWVEET